ncbi:MAG: hypothetical protein MJ107_02915 [Lachnospiraceae bacterium]|nr:hypothetical protein [Lachnospiraceae bacterium]
MAANASVAKETTVYYSVDNGKTWNTEVPTITNVGKTLVLVKAENKNYVDANASYTLEVTAKSVTVKANSLSKVYGTKDETLTAIVDGTLNSDEVIYTLEREAGEDVGDYTITPSGEVEQGNYSVIFETGTYTITKANTLVVNGTPYTGNYDGFEHGEAAIPSVIEGTKVEYSVDGGAWTETVPTITNVGTFNVSVKATNANYKEAKTSYTLKVNPKSVTVTADANSKTYGDADPVLTATISGVIGSDTVVYSVVRESGENVGSYTITPGGADIQGNYSVSYETATFTINKSNALTVVGTNYEGTYDAKAHGEAAKPSVAEGTTVYYSVDNGATWTTEVPVRTNAGTTEVMVKAANANYNDSPEATYTLTVNAKAVIVTAVDNSKIYGEEDPVLTATFSGTIGTDSVSYVVKRKVGEDVGDYEITVGGAAIQGNYAVSYVSATFTIKKSSELTVVGTNYEGVYDAEAHGEAAKPSVAEGTTVFYSVDNGATWTTEVPVRTNVGTTEVKVMAANANYIDSPEATYTLTVEAKAVTVTAEAKISVYGEPFETLTAVVEGNLNGDTIVYTLTKAEGENVGTYAITAAGAEYQGNYKVSYVDSFYEITKAGTLTVSGKNYSDVYDAAAHGEAATPSVTEGTTVEYSVDGGAWTTEVPTIEEVGIKTVEVRATNANYLVAKTTYTLEVTAKEVTVAAIDNGKVYGDADPELKANVTGLLNDDEVTYTVTREKGEDVVAGGYVITVAGEEIQGNYKVTYVSGKFEITKKAATVTADNLEKVYGDADATLTATVEGTVGEDVLDYTIDREAGENVGVYAIVVTEGTNNNYDVTVVDGQYTINKKNVTLTVANATKIVGKADPVFTASTEEGALVGTDTLVYTLVRAVGERIGTYVITANVIEEENPNYNVTVVPGVLTIKAAPKLPEDPEDPEVPEDPDVPVTPTVPDVPVVPTVPDVPVVPVPVVPEAPEEPENPTPEVVIEDEDTPLAPEAPISESAIEKETPVEVEIEDEDVPLAAADHCFIHWIILASTVLNAIYVVLRSLAMRKKKDEEAQTEEN